MAIAAHRPYTAFVPIRPRDPSKSARDWSEPATAEMILEDIRARADLKERGRAIFPGTVREKNKLWLDRNFLRQASSNYEASRVVANRSAGLLQYYALLNFAKAELLVTNPSAVIGKRLGHGLSFNPLKARTVSGDFLTVPAGVFPLLYESRTGHKLPPSTKLSVKSLLRQVPEIGSQLKLVGIEPGNFNGLLHIIAKDELQSWPFIALQGSLGDLDKPTRSLILKSFQEVTPPDSWRDHFGVSTRMAGNLTFLEGRVAVPHVPGGQIDTLKVLRVTWSLKDILANRESEVFDALVVPSFVKSRLFVMTPSLARYALAFYASSLVRYRPAMFDAQLSPDQAFLFDAVTREISLPILVDAFTGLLGEDQFFHPRNDLRV